MASPQMEGLKAAMRQMMAQGLVPRFDGCLDPEVLRKVVQAAQAGVPAVPGVHFESCEMAGMETELSVPEDARKDAVIIYIHGGGLVCGNAKTSRGYASMLAAETKIPVYAFSYRLAPEDPYPAAVDDSFAFYKAVLEKHPGLPVFLIGESGGGYLSIVTALRARDEDVRIPAGIIPYSPPIDFSNAVNRDFPGNKDFTIDPNGLDSLAGLYCPDKALLKEPYVSPYYASYAGMPPMLLAWDESESLAPDAEILRDKALAAGVEVHAKSYPDCFHAFAASGRGTPESEEVLLDTVAFIHAHIS